MQMCMRLACACTPRAARSARMLTRACASQCLHAVCGKVCTRAANQAAAEGLGVAIAQLVVQRLAANTVRNNFGDQALPKKFRKQIAEEDSFRVVDSPYVEVESISPRVDRCRYKPVLGALGIHLGSVCRRLFVRNDASPALLRPIETFLGLDLIASVFTVR